jgi:hypothetical protein
MASFTPAAAAIATRRDASSYTEMSFPKVLGPHSMMLNFSGYSSTPVGTISRNPGSSSIALPIPTNLADSFSMKVGPYELGAFGNAARGSTELAARYFGGGELTTDDAKAMLDNAIAVAGQVGLQAASGVISAIGGEAAIKGLQVGAGAIQNPYLALTFDGIDLKTHNFSWQLAPESSEDSQVLKRIIDHIKYHAVPGYKFGSSRAFLEYPSVVDIFFIGTEEGYLYPFKRCMINNLEINYAGGGMPAFVEGGRPAVVNLTMALTEMEIWTKDQIGGQSAGGG